MTVVLGESAQRKAHHGGNNGNNNKQQQQKDGHSTPPLSPMNGYNDENIDYHNINGAVGGQKGATSSSSFRKATSRRSVRGGKISQGVGRIGGKASSPIGAGRSSSGSPIRKRYESNNSIVEEENKVGEQQQVLLKVKEVVEEEQQGGVRFQTEKVLRSPLHKKKTRSPSPRIITSQREATTNIKQVEEMMGSPKSETKSSWKSTATILVFEALILIAAVLFVTPRYEPPNSSSKPFFHAVHENEPFSFEIEVNAWPEPTFQWRLNGVDIEGATERRLSVPKASMRNSGTYTCVIENMAGRYVWEEGYVNVIADAKDKTPSSSSSSENGTTNERALTTASSSDHSNSPGDSARVRQTRMCLLKRAPEPVLRSASIDGGAAVIAAGEAAGYLDCFDGLSRMLATSPSQQKPNQQVLALDLLRSLHGSSNQRNLLVNVVAALDDLAIAKLEGKPQAVLDDLSSKLAFEAGLYCASTPQCTGGDIKGRSRIVDLISHALVGSDMQ